MKNFSQILIPAILTLFSFQLFAQPTADFSFNISTCGNRVEFTNLSSGGAITSIWNFGDGQTSNQWNPIHIYQSPGTYAVNLTVQDSANNSDDIIYSVIVNQNSLVSLNIIKNNNNICDSTGGFICDGFAEAIPSGGTPPYQFSWSNGATSSILTGLCAGFYSVTVTDSSGCFGSAVTQITDSSTFSSQLTSVQNTTCGNCDGFVSISPAGGTPPYQYLWSTGGLGSTQSGLCPGFYGVTIVDANNCNSIQDSIFIGGQSSCFDTIRGHVFVDDNGNCVQDSSEQNAPNVRIDITPGGAVFTDFYGNYTFITDTGSYDLTVGSNVDVICPPSEMHSVNFSAAGQTSTGNDFGVEIPPVQDLRASIYCNVARPGFDQYLTFTIFNDGDLATDIVIAYELDSNLTFTALGYNTLSPDSIDAQNNIIYWSIDSLQALHFQNFRFYAQIPTIPQINIGDIISNSVTVYPLTNDIASNNNTDYCNNVVTGSYDPNDKAVTPSGEGSEGNITQQDTLMHYRIRFQNTGTDTAFTVVIRDTLDTDLDWSSFEMGTASHPYEVSFEEDDILVFTFNNILLPDSNVNEPESHGHVTFYMEHNGILPLGTEIENRAAIYFDFNPPIITNTVMNKIYKPVGIEEVRSLNVNLYPNPTDNHVVIDAVQETIKRIIVTDISGKQLMDVQSLNTQKHQLNLKVEAGIYLVQVYTNKGVATKKMVVK